MSDLQHGDREEHYRKQLGVYDCLTKKERTMTYAELGTKQDIADALRVLDATGMATRCTGGRIVLAGYTCLHCGADNSVGPCKGVKRNAT